MMEKYIAIKAVKYLHDYKLKILFDDGKEEKVDFEVFIKSSHHPDIIKYKDITKFKQFNLTYGDLEWNDYELSFPVNDLYQDDILH